MKRARLVKALLLASPLTLLIEWVAPSAPTFVLYDISAVTCYWWNPKLDD